MKDYVIRFSVWERFEHAAVMVLFLVLAVTGLPQEFFWQSWARWLILVMGGIERVRWVHRGAGILFAALVVFHLAVALVRVSTRRVKASLVPKRKDFLDAIAMMRYYLRLADEPPRFDRFDYRQKFEYWGMVIGSVVIIVTGFMLYFPVETARVLPGQVIPAALLMHGREGLLAFLVIIIWHLYNAHLSPDVFPFDSGIFTGKISAERMEKEHGLEYDRLLAAEGAKSAPTEPAKPAPPAGAGSAKPGI
jgi:cytochrome b subunit of formate dehydrogenase